VRKKSNLHFFEVFALNFALFAVSVLIQKALNRKENTKISQSTQRKLSCRTNYYLNQTTLNTHSPMWKFEIFSMSEYFLKIIKFAKKIYE